MIDPHAEARISRSGAPLKSGVGALILLHGRGGSAEDMLALGAELDLPGVSLIAPQAAGQTWYPNSFLAPTTSNEPWLSSALNAVRRVLESCLSAGLPTHRIAVLGFSQGACLASEFVARHPLRYAGLVAWTGGLLGPQGSSLQHAGDLTGTPVLLSSGDPDQHVPWSRVEETAYQFSQMGASVHSKKYPHRPHTILLEEVKHARELLLPAFADATTPLSTVSGTSSGNG